MPYVRCGSCGTTGYATRPHVRAPECPVCGDRLVDPCLAVHPLMRATPEGAGATGGNAPRRSQKSRRPADDNGLVVAEH
jgi:hypothetical protein